MRQKPFRMWRNALLASLLVACSALAKPLVSELYNPWKIGSIQVDEATQIQRVLSVVVHKVDGREQALEQLRLEYEKAGSEFLRFVVLDQIAELGGLEILSAHREPLLEFARIVERDIAEARKYLDTIDNPISKWRFHFWLQRRSEDPPVLDSREYRVGLERSRLERSVAEMGDGEKATFLLKMLEDWENPMQYEACLPMLELMQEKEGDLIVFSLSTMMESIQLPSESPPPYTRQQDVFMVLCKMATILGDERLLPVLRTRLDAASKFEKVVSRQAVEWLESGIPYPWEYENAARIFEMEG